MKLVPASPPAALALVLALYLLLAAGYCQATPILEAGDEFRHFFVVRHLAEGRGLPVLGADRGDPFSPEQEAGQPPLYHLLAALVSGWVDARDARDLWLNPHHVAGRPSVRPENANFLVHTERERFPHRGVTLAVHVARALSVAIGAIAVALAYRLARRAVPELAAAGPLAAAAVAFNPMFLFVSASVANDSLIAAAAAGALLGLVALLQDGPSPRRLLACSALLGLAALAKLSGLALLPLAAGALAVQAATQRQWRALPGRLLVLAAGPAALAGWWYLRNHALYGDPLGLEAWLAVSGRRAESPGLIELAGEAQGLFLSYWGVFGLFSIIADFWVYEVYFLLCLAALLGVAIGVGAGWIGARGRASILLLFGLWLLLLAGPLVRWTQLTPASSGRLLFPAIASNAALLAAGWLAPVPARLRGPAALAVGGVLFALAVLLPVQYIAPSYARPQPLTRETVGEPTRRLDRDFGGKLELLGYDLDRNRARPGETVNVTLYWRVTAAMAANYSVSVQLMGPLDLLGQLDLYPGQGKLATRLLQPEDHLRDRFAVQVRPDAPAPLDAPLKVVVYEYRAPASAQPGECCLALDEAVVGELLIEPSDAPPEPEVGTPVGAELGGQARLLGYTLPTRAVAPGQTLPLTLYWQAVRRMTRDYTLFVHLVDDAGRTVAQYDSQPRHARFPTSWWRTDEVVADPVAVPVGPTVSPGTYRLLVGLYTLQDLVRLTRPDGTNAVDLGVVAVRPG